MRRWQIAVLLLVLSLTACTDGVSEPSPTNPPTTTTTSTTTTTTVPAPEAADLFRQCLAELGIAIPPIPVDGTGRLRLDVAMSELDFADPVVATAVASCSGILGHGALDLSQDEIIRSVVQGRLEEFSVCVRRNGVADFPDPIDGFNGVGSPFPMAEIPYEHPGLEQAVTLCREQVLSTLPG